jgi:hypothetical protein
MSALLLRTGLRRPPTEGKVKRLEVMMNHGCRKFYKINAPKLKAEVYPIHNVNAFPGIDKYKV